MAVVALVPYFIPARKQTESLQDQDTPATHGSLWRRWYAVPSCAAVVEAPVETAAPVDETLGLLGDSGSDPESIGRRTPPA